jgi:Sec-independent protein translocase protein TatA
MEFLGIGPTEFLFIIVIAILILGPKDLAKTGRAVGKWFNGLVQSDTWKVMQEMRRLPTQLMREEGLEKDLAEADKNLRAGAGTAPAGENSIQPDDLVSGPPAEELKPEAGEKNA